MMHDPKLDHPSLDAYRKQQQEIADKVFRHLPRYEPRGLSNVAARLRAVAERLDAIDMTDYVPTAAAMTHEMLSDRVDAIEQVINLLLGDPDAPPLSGPPIKVHP